MKLNPQTRSHHRVLRVADDDESNFGQPKSGGAIAATSNRATTNFTVGINERKKLKSVFVARKKAV